MMKVLFISFQMLVFIGLNASAQSKIKAFVGYNTFNEVYAGVQFPKVPVVELGYQFALTQTAQISGGILDLPNPFMTNNAYGLRARFGYQFPWESVNGYSVIYFEYQNLQSNELTLSRFSGSSYAPWAEFKDSYAKYGFRIGHGIPIRKSPISFTFSLGVFYMQVHRIYSVERISGKNLPSTRVDDFDKPTIQLTAGLKIFIN